MFLILGPWVLGCLLHAGKEICSDGSNSILDWNEGSKGDYLSLISPGSRIWRQGARYNSKRENYNSKRENLQQSHPEIGPASPEEADALSGWNFAGDAVRRALALGKQ